jgi:hypothetical protein
MAAEHKDTYEMHDKIVRAESSLKAAGWVSGEMIPYDSESPLKTDWGVRYLKGETVVYLNRFTAETITNLL